MVTHDPVAAAYTDRVVFLADGRVVDELREPDREQVLEWMAAAEPADAGAPDGHAPRAAWKSLLGAQGAAADEHVRDRRSASRSWSGSLVFTDTLSTGFTALFGSSVGDVVVRPARAARRSTATPRPRTVPASLVDRAGAGARGGPRRRQRAARSASSWSARTARSSAASAPRRSASTTPTRRPATALPGLTLLAAAMPPHGRDEVVLDEQTAEKARLRHRRRRSRSSPRPRKAVLTERLVGIAGFADGTLAGRRDPDDLRHRRPRRSCSCSGKDAFTDVWVTAEPGVSQAQLRDAVAAGAARRTSRRVTGDDAADESRQPGARRGVVVPHARSC